jgi:hypothetical protein
MKITQPLTVDSGLTVFYVHVEKHRFNVQLLMYIWIFFLLNFFTHIFVGSEEICQDDKYRLNVNFWQAKPFTKMYRYGYWKKTLSANIYYEIVYAVL